MGHYRVAAQNDDLSYLLATMVNIGIRCGLAMERWKHSMNIMVEKDKGSPKIHQLRIIQLLEADFNFALHVLFGKRMIQFVDKYCGLNESQYGSRPGKLCQSVVINKILTYDILRMTQKNAAFAEFDATANYNRMIPALVALACRRLGMKGNTTDMFLDAMENISHKVRTAFGESEETYQTDNAFKVFGTGQGSGGSPAFWLAISNVMLGCIDRDYSGIRLTNPQQTVIVDRNEDVFVDNASMAVDNREGCVVASLHDHAQCHERYLYATGGQLALHKCFWVLVAWEWENGQASLSPYNSKQFGGNKLEDRRVMLIHIQNGEAAVIKRIGPDEDYRTLLGIFLSVNGNFGPQPAILTKTTRDWLYKVRHSLLNRVEKLIAYGKFLLPQVLYVTPCLYTNAALMQATHRPALEMALHTLGVNRNFPQAIAYAGKEYFGLDLTDYAVLQGMAQLKMYMGHRRVDNQTGCLLRIAKDHVKLVIGWGECQLERPETTRVCYVESSWITALSRFLYVSGGKLINDDKRIFQKQRENDVFLMDKANLYSALEQRRIQRCQLYLRVTLLSDVFTTNGRSIDHAYLIGDRARKSSLVWPTQERPGQIAWSIWKKILGTFARSSSNHLREQYKLEKWINTHQVWK